MTHTVFIFYFFQERIRKESSPDPFSMMLAMNGISAIILIFATFVTGEAPKFLAFVQRHPESLKHLSLLALAGGGGQMFIFYMVSVFGALPCSIVTTTRKFFTVIFSVIFMQNPLQLHQWFAAVLVFGALFGDMYFSHKNNQRTEKAQEGETDALNKLTEDDLKLKQVEIQKITTVK